MGGGTANGSAQESERRQETNHCGMNQQRKRTSKAIQLERQSINLLIDGADWIVFVSGAPSFFHEARQAKGNQTAIPFNAAGAVRPALNWICLVSRGVNFSSSLFVNGWAAVVFFLQSKRDEQPTQPNQLLAPCSAAIGGCWLIKERVGELPFFFCFWLVMGSAPLAAAEVQSN